MANRDLKATITFHRRTIEARAFAGGLDRVAARYPVPRGRGRLAVSAA
ncbi:hypothetical protein [Streptomyces jumonjinensis]|nr:hypothetical protein [Streptomyces jumonjinensis]